MKVGKELSAYHGRSLIRNCKAGFEELRAGIHYHCLHFTGEEQFNGAVGRREHNGDWEVEVLR